MKNRVLNSFILLAMVGLMFTSCKKDYPEPPIQNLPIGTVYTIDSILKMQSGKTFTEDASVYGIVTADEVSGNLYKAAFMQDRATGAALELYMDATSGVRIGDSIRVYLKGVTYSVYNGLPQLNGFEPDGHIVILANNKPITPAVVTLADVLSGQYLGQLVKVKNVKFAEMELTQFAEANTYGNRTLVDVDQTDYFATVRTSNYANFAKNTLPQGKGSVVCIASVYQTSSATTWQLLIRSISELSFDGYYTALPYFQAFTADFGSYTPISVAGDQVWSIAYQTAQISGYENSTNYINEDWLVSSPVAISGIDHAKVRVNYVAQYSNSNTEDVTLQVSTDYVAGMDLLQANWTQMNVTFSTTSGWDDFQTIECSLDEFIGQTVTVAVKFLSSASQSRTMEVKFISVEEGEASGGGGGGGGNGGELQSLPYSQSFASGFGTYTTKDVLGPQSWEIDYGTAKMTGYSGGSNANEDWLISSPVAVTGVSEAKVSVVYAAQYQTNNANDVTLQVSTDYVFDNEPNTATWIQMDVTYPNTSNWSDFQTVETSLNDFIGQNITVAIKYVSDDSQSRTIEIQSITVQEGSGVGPTPPPGNVVGDGSRENPYTANDIILMGIETSDGNKYWVKDYIVGAIDPNNNYVYEFTASTSVKTNLIISSNVGASTENECVPVQLPAGAVRDGLNLAENSGNYQQEVLLYGTLEKYFQKPSVKNVTYAEINGNSFGTDPGAPTPPPTQGIFSETFASGQGDFVIQDVNLDGLNYVWKHDATNHYMKASSYVSNTPHETESWLVSPVIDLSGVTAATLKFDQNVNYATATTPNSILHVMVSTNYSGDVQNATWSELTLDQWPAGDSWTTSHSSTDLAGFVGQQITIAFKYTSLAESGKCPTWEVFNLVVE